MLPRFARLVSATLPLAALLALASAPPQADAADYFLTIGGGYAPTGNQVSLEKNVLFFQRLLNERYPDGAAHDIYFSDGDDPQRDLQFHDPTFELPKAHRLLAQVFRSEKYLNYRYRNHQIPNLRGGTTRDSIRQWFDEAADRLKEGDRLFIYVTAHGGKASDKKTPHNTGLYVWNRQKLDMKELAAELDKLPSTIPVAVVMVQCYSGGFANIIFDKGDAEAGFTRANRCGFFATVHDRPAAGCTPDISEDNYREYSSYFWAAIRGKTRTEQEVTSGDFNGDGDVTFAEAHAYAQLTSTTIDISVKTSDAFLRKYSRFRWEMPANKPAANKPAANGDAEPDAAQDERPPAPEPPNHAENAAPPKPALLTADTPYDQLFSLATPEQKAVLAGLSADLNLQGAQRAAAARKLAEQILKEKKQVEGELKKATSALNGTCQQIRNELQAEWPELANRYHPVVSELLSNQADQLVEAIESHSAYSKMQQQADQVRGLASRRLDLDRRWARVQRLIRELENVALAANLPAVATTDVVERYKQLVAAESMTLARN